MSFGFDIESFQWHHEAKQRFGEGNVLLAVALIEPGEVFGDATVVHLVG